MARKSILVAVDGSASARKALELAAQLSKSTEGDLLIATITTRRPLTAAELEEGDDEPGLHPMVVESAFATSPGETYSPVLERSPATPASDYVHLAAAQRLVAAAAFNARQAGAPSVQTIIETGDPADEILRIVKSRAPDLVVVGSRGLGKRAERLLGGVSQKIMRDAPCPVLVVEPSDEEE